MSRRSRQVGQVERLQAATAHLAAPYAVVDVDAVRANAADLERRAAGTPLRLASKSVRVRDLQREVLRRPGWRGVLAFTLPEALWLVEVEPDLDDVVVGYPSVDAAALARLGADERALARVTVMVDDPAQLDRTVAALPAAGAPGPVRVCLELDASYRPAGGRGGVHLGARRSPLHEVDEVVALARRVAEDPRFALVGLMAYEGQIAGVGDAARGPRGAAVRALQRRSADELAARRAAVVTAVREVADLDFVNGGGTGSVAATAAEDAVTEVAAGSGLLAPRLFDGYTGFTPEPAAFFVLDVVRRPSPRHATVLGGGWTASGAAGRDRLPVPWWPDGLRLTGAEGAGEVQTPLTGAGAGRLAVGDRVWFRHAKAGELAEHVTEVHLVERGELVGRAATYRGEGRAFL